MDFSREGEPTDEKQGFSHFGQGGDENYKGESISKKANRKT